MVTASAYSGDARGSNLTDELTYRIVDIAGRGLGDTRHVCVSDRGLRKVKVVVQQILLLDIILYTVQGHSKCGRTPPAMPDFS